jgi:WD40 repeat protein
MCTVVDGESRCEDFCALGGIRIWDTESELAATQVITGHAGFIYGLAWSPDGQFLATAGADKMVNVWDLSSDSAIPLTDGQPPSTSIPGHRDIVTSVAFSPDGTLLASGSVDATVILFDAGAYQAIGQPLAGHAGAVSSIAFSPDGKRLASGGYDANVILWDLDLDSWVVKACTRAGRNLNPGEWLSYFGDAPYRESCP